MLSVVKHLLKTSYVAELYGISQRRVQQLAKEYRETGEIPKIEKRGRKPYKNYPTDIQQRVIEAKKKNDSLQTPEQAFYSRLDDVVLGNFMKLIERKDKLNLRDDFEVKS